MKFDICNPIMNIRDWQAAFVECVQQGRAVSVFDHPIFKGRYTMNWSKA